MEPVIDFRQLASIRPPTIFAHVRHLARAKRSPPQPDKSAWQPMHSTAAFRSTLLPIMPADRVRLAGVALGIVKAGLIAVWCVLSSTDALAQNSSRKPSAEVDSTTTGELAPLLSVIQQNNETLEVRLSAVRQIAALGDRAAPAVAPMLHLIHENQRAYSQVVRALRRIGEPAVPALLNGLSHRNSFVRRAAAISLARISTKSEKALEPLRKATQDHDTYVRRAAISALAAFGSRAVPTLVTALQRQDEWMVRNAAQALGKIGSDARPAMHSLVDLLNDKNRRVRHSAIRALPMIGPVPVPRMVELLEHGNHYARSSAAEILGKSTLPTETAVQALLKALGDRHEVVRFEAVRAVHKLGLSQQVVVDALITTLNDTDNRVAAEAIRTLANTGPQVLPSLITALSHDNDQIRGAVCKTMKSLGAQAGPAVPQLIDRLHDPVLEVRRLAIEALGGVGESAQAATAELAGILGSEQRGLRPAAMVTLGQIRDPATFSLIAEFLDDQQIPIRHLAQRTLRQLDSVRANRLLGEQYDATIAARADISKLEVGKLDWPQWGGSRLRNNVPEGRGIPVDWHPGEFDRETGDWIPDKARNIKWVARLGSQSYGNPVVANGRVFVGTNNGAGYLERYPSRVDLGCLLCFDEQTGKFLWQYSSEKLATGRVHDWPLQGICASTLVDGDRLWCVTNRCEVICLDIDGFYDGEDDGRSQREFGRLFVVAKNDDVDADHYRPALTDGKLTAHLRRMFSSSGMDISANVRLQTGEEEDRWFFTADVDGRPRQFRITLEGPQKLSAFKLITPDDKREADVIWRFDMMAELEVSPHNMSFCSVITDGKRLFVNTANGVNNSHLHIPSPHAPSFMALDRDTGQVLWTDNSPGPNILHGQWSSPTYAVLGGRPQVLFAGGDGWLYSFDPHGDGQGKSKLLWKFDCNPKDAKWILGGRGTRSNVTSFPVVYDDLVYVTVGQDPEHGEGVGHLWCISPTKTGDVSPQLVFNIKDPTKPIGHKRLHACEAEKGDFVRDNPNSALVWRYTKHDLNADGEIDFEEEFHRAVGTPAIKDELLYVADFSGLFHCINAKTGVPYWTYDLLASCWGSPLIVDGKVYIGDEDGEVAVFRHSPDPRVAMKEVAEELVPINAATWDSDVEWEGEVASMGDSIYTTPIVANNTLYIANRRYLFAIAADE